MIWLLLLLDHAAALTLQTLSPSAYSPNANAWTNTNGQYISSQSGDGTYIEFQYNSNDVGGIGLIINAYGYTGSSTSPVPAPYTIKIDGQDYNYFASQTQPVEFKFGPAFLYQISISAPSPATGVIVNSVVLSLPDPLSSTPITTSSLPPSSTITSTTQTSSSVTSSLPSGSSSPITSTGNSTGTGKFTSTVVQSLGAPIFFTVSGSVVTQEIQPSALSSSSSSSSSGTSLGIVIGPIVGAIVVMILAAIVYLKRRDRARWKREQSGTESYLVETEIQQSSASGDSPTIDETTMTESSQSPFWFSNRGARIPWRQRAAVPAKGRVSYITSESLAAPAYGEIEGSNSGSDSRRSMSNAEDESVAPPAYVERENDAAQ